MKILRSTGKSRKRRFVLIFGAISVLAILAVAGSAGHHQWNHNSGWWHGHGYGFGPQLSR